MMVVKVLDTCPVEEHEDFPLPRDALSLFSFPEGLHFKRTKLLVRTIT